MFRMDSATVLFHLCILQKVCLPKQFPTREKELDKEYLLDERNILYIHT